MIRVVHPGSGCWLPPIPDPGSGVKKAPNPGSRIRISNTERLLPFSNYWYRYRYPTLECECNFSSYFDCWIECHPVLSTRNTFLHRLDYRTPVPPVKWVKVRLSLKTTVFFFKAPVRTLPTVSIQFHMFALVCPGMKCLPAYANAYPRGLFSTNLEFSAFGGKRPALGA